MPKFGKGHKFAKGRIKGSKNKATLLFHFEGITENDKKIIFAKAMELVKKGNVTIINKLIDKMIYNAEPKQKFDEIEVPINVNDLSDQQANELYEKLVNQNAVN